MFTSRGLRPWALRPGITRPSIAPRLYLASSARPRLSVPRPATKAWESTAVADTGAAEVNTSEGEKGSGHIGVEPNESILFFDNIFPLNLSNILVRPWKTDQDVTDLMRRFESSSLGIMEPIRMVKTAIPKDASMKVTEILPRLKDGGAFVKFQHDPSIDASKIEEHIVSRLHERPLKPWFNPFRRVKARLVRGTPWLEDLARYPTNLVRVEFVPPEAGQTPQELSEESLYTLFRKFGRISDIIPQATDSKESPRFAQVQFPLMRDAIMARNCMHGFIVGETLGGGKTGTKLRMSYQKKLKAHSIWNWLTNHPRIVIPVIAAFVAGISVIIFDPIREFFIKMHIQHSLKFTESRVYKWFRSRTNNFAGFANSKEDDDSLSTVWNHRRDIIDQLRSWLDGASDTFIVVTGPRGSGKNDMVMKQSLGEHENVLKIDCRPIVEARGESGTIRRLAASVGYRPVFSWANSISSMVDLAVQSTTGVKAGFSETLESQLNKILHTAGSALKEVALSGRSRKDKDANASEDAYLESHPDKRPVVVIDNFLHKAEDKGIVYDKISDWAASLVQNNIAHVIFLTSNSGYTKQLSKALPDRVLRTVSLGDLEPDVAKNFVLTRVDDHEAERKSQNGKEKNRAVYKKPDLTGLDECIETVGGRLTDLEFLTRRIKTGQSPKQAVDEIVSECATDIVKMFLLTKPADEHRRWSTQQAWSLVKGLASNPSLRYNSVALSAPFASSASSYATDPDAALEGLENAELITVKYQQGRPSTISAAKPLSQAAFAVLVGDRVLKAKMDLAVMSEMAKDEAKTIDGAEKELALLGSLPKQPGETSERIRYLLGKVQGSQASITKLEKEMGALKKILNSEN